MMGNEPQYVALSVPAVAGTVPMVLVFNYERRVYALTARQAAALYMDARLTGWEPEERLRSDLTTPIQPRGTWRPLDEARLELRRLGLIP